MKCFSYARLCAFALNRSMCRPQNTQKNTKIHFFTTEFTENTEKYSFNHEKHEKTRKESKTGVSK